MIELLPNPGLGLDIDPEGARKYLAEGDEGFFDRVSKESAGPHPSSHLESDQKRFFNPFFDLISQGFALAGDYRPNTVVNPFAGG